MTLEKRETQKYSHVTQTYVLVFPAWVGVQNKACLFFLNKILPDDVRKETRVVLSVEFHAEPVSLKLLSIWVSYVGAMTLGFQDYNH